MKDQEFINAVNKNLQKHYPNITVLAVDGLKWSVEFKGILFDEIFNRFSFALIFNKHIDTEGIKSVEHLREFDGGSYLGIETTDGRKFTAYFDCGVIWEQDWDGEHPDDIPQCVFKVRNLLIGDPTESEVA